MARIAGYGGNVLVAQQVIENCEDAWNEQTGTGVTASADSSDYKVGSASAKFALTAAALVEITASEVVTSMDLSSLTQLLFWAKCSIGLAAGDFQILLDEHALCASPSETLDIPALTANVWKYCSIAFAGAAADRDAIISVGLKQAVDKGALNIWLDHIEAAKQVAGIKAWSLDEITEVLETTGFDSGGHKVFIPGTDHWAGSFEGYKDGAPLPRGTVVGLELQESSMATQQWRGLAIITAIHPSVAVDGLVTYTYDFQGTRELMIPTA